MLRRLRSLCISAFAAAFLLLSDGRASAVPWTAADPGDLLTGTNWSGGVAPNAVNAFAEIYSAPTNSGNFTLNGTMTLGAMVFSNSAPRSIDGTGTLTFNTGNSFTPHIQLFQDLSNPKLTIAVRVAGTQGLLVFGFEKLELLNANNSYSGGTEISQAILSGNSIANSGSNSAFGAGTSFSISNGATLQYTGSTASTNRTISLGTGSGAVDVSNAATNLAVSGVISGAMGLTKTGAGTLTLSGSNSYGGPTTISGGTLSGNTIAAPGTNSSFGRGNTFTISNGATLEYTGSTVGVDQTITLGTGGGRISVTQSGTILPINQPISGTSLNKAGAGVLRFDAANTYIGSTTIEAGELRLNSSNLVPDTSAVTVNSGATFNLLNSNETIGSLAGAGSVTNVASLTTGGDNSTTAFSGVISGSGSLTKTGSGTMTLSGANSYSGTTTITGGTLSGNSLANSGSNSSFGTGGFTLSGGGTLEYAGPIAFTNRTIALGTGDGVVSVTQAATSLTQTGAINGIGGLTKAGAGTLLLGGGTRGYVGDTTIADGVLRTGGFNVVPNFTNLIVNFGATFDLNGFSQQVGSLSGSGSVSLGSGTIHTIGAASTTFSGVISGTGMVAHGLGSPSTLTLTGTNTYTGGTWLGSGTLTLGSSGAIGTTGTINFSGGTLKYTTDNTIDYSARFSTANSQTWRIDTNGQLVTFASNLTSNGGSLSKLGDGKLTLSGSNSYTSGTFVSGGTLSGNTITNSGTSSAFGGGSSFSISNGATLQFTGSTTTDTNRTISLGTGGGVIDVFQSSGTLRLNGAISGSGGLTKTGSGLLYLWASNTYSGATNIATGGKVLAGGNSLSENAIPDNSAVTIDAGGRLELGDDDETIGSLAGAGSLGFSSPTGAAILRTGGNNTSTTFSGPIGGGAFDQLVKQGSGTFTLTAANTYGGGTTISGGTLLANNTTGSATGTGQITVNADGTLGGTGAVSGAVVVNNGGTLAPGASIESLAVGALTFNSGSTFDVEINTDLSLSLGADLVNANGILSISPSGALLNLSVAGTTIRPTASKYTLISYSGVWNGNSFDGYADDSSFIVGSNQYVINYNDTTGGSNFGGGPYGNFVTLTVTAVPEASAALFGGLICISVGLTVAIRRRMAARSRAAIESV